MKRILILDDEADIRDIISDFLNIKGFKVETASNGKLGLSKFESFNPHLALVDLDMPEMNGVEFSKIVLARNKTFPILIITAYLHRYNESEIIQMGVREIISKPIQFDLLLKKIQQHIT